VKLLDGSTLLMSDTAANQACFPQQGNQNPGLGYPIARVSVLICMASGAIIDSDVGRYAGKNASEQALLAGLLGSLTAGDVLLADRFYCGYAILAVLQAQGVDAVVQQHQRRGVDFRKGKRLGSGDHLVRWDKPKHCPNWLDEANFQALPETLQVREVRVGRKILVTTLSDARTYSRESLEALYRDRWQVELDLRNIKSVLKLELLNCRTPLMCLKQWWAGLLAYNVIRMLMLRAAQLSDLDVREISFKHSVQLACAWQNGRRQSRPSSANLLPLISQNRVRCRPGRIEPRSVKRRPKPYPFMTKPRVEMRKEIQRHGHPKKLK